MWADDFMQLIGALQQLGYSRFQPIDAFNVIICDIMKDGTNVDVLICNASETGTDYTITYHARTAGISPVGSLNRRMVERNLADLSRIELSQFKVVFAGNAPYLSIYKKGDFVWDPRYVSHKENDVVLNSKMDSREIRKSAKSRNNLFGIEMLNYACATGGIMNNYYAHIATAVTGVQMYK